MSSFISCVYYIRVLCMCICLFVVFSCMHICVMGCGLLALETPKAWLDAYEGLHDPGARNVVPCWAA